MPKMIHHQTRLAVIEAKKESISEAVLGPAGWLILALIFAAPFGIVFWHSASFGWWALVGIWYASMVVWLLLFFILVGPLFIVVFFFKIEGGSGLAILGMILCLLWAVLGLLAYGYTFFYLEHEFGSRPISWPYLIFLTGLADILIFAILFAAYLILVWIPVTLTASSFLERQIADALFVDHILRAMEISATPKRSWYELSTKNRLMDQLEKAARIASEKIPRALRTLDTHTDSLEQNRFNQVAASLRAKKQWVCTPKWDTRERLQEALTAFFVNAVLGSWDSLEIEITTGPINK
jgi:hypothetical protein